MTEDPVGQPPGKQRWSASDYLVFAAAGGFVLGIVAAVAASSDNPGLATFILLVGGFVVCTWWLIGCAAIGAQVALRARDRARDGAQGL
jgi:hypothetical protein